MQLKMGCLTCLSSKRVALDDRKCLYRLPGSLCPPLEEQKASPKTSPSA